MEFKFEVDIGPAAGRAFHGYWSGNRVYSPYTVRDTLTFDSSPVKAVACQSGSRARMAQAVLSK